MDRRSVRESVDAKVSALAALQHGAFSREQAMERGATKSIVKRRLVACRWERLYAGVYRLPGYRESWHQKLIVACFAWGPGAAISHSSSAALRRLPGFRPGPVELSVPRGRERNAPGIVHRPLSLPAVDVEVVDAIPVTTTARTLLDIAAAVTAEVLEEALDDALRRGLVTIRRLRWRLNETARMGRPGTAKLRALLDARDGSSRVPQSVFETRVLRAILKAGLPEPVLQYEIRDGGRLIAIVDFAYPDERVAIEAEGREWHDGRVRFEGDLGRRNALTALGWRAIHATWWEFHAHPELVIRTIERALRHARRG